MRQIIEQPFKVLLVPLYCRRKLSVNSMQYQCKNVRPLFPAVVWSRLATMSLVTWATAMQPFLVNQLYSSISKNKGDWKNWLSCIYIALSLCCTGQVRNITILRKYVDKVSFISTQISIQLNQNNFVISRPYNKRKIWPSMLHRIQVYYKWYSLWKFYVSFKTRTSREMSQPRSIKNTGCICKYAIGSVYFQYIF